MKCLHTSFFRSRWDWLTPFHKFEFSGSFHFVAKESFSKEKIECLQLKHLSKRNWEKRELRIKVHRKCFHVFINVHKNAFIFLDLLLYKNVLNRHWKSDRLSSVFPPLLVAIFGIGKGQGMTRTKSGKQQVRKTEKLEEEFLPQLFFFLLCLRKENLQCHGEEIGSEAGAEKVQTKEAQIWFVSRNIRWVKYTCNKFFIKDILAELLSGHRGFKSPVYDFPSYKWGLSESNW